MIVISPWAKVPRNGVKCAKNYYAWKDVVRLLRDKGIQTVQVGVSGEKLIGADETKLNLSFPELLQLLKSADTFISVDNVIPHFAHYHGLKGVVIFSKSSPDIFGYSENVNLLKDKKYLRSGKNQWLWWNDCPYDENAFVSPEEVVAAVERVIRSKDEG